jgi:integrase
MRPADTTRSRLTLRNTEKNLIILNDPKKGSKPRIWKVSPELIAMLKMLPKTSTKIFGEGPTDSMKAMYIKTRRPLAVNSRIRDRSTLHFTPSDIGK